MNRRTSTALVAPVVLAVLLAGCTSGGSGDDGGGDDGTTSTGGSPRSAAGSPSDAAPAESDLSRLARLAAQVEPARADVCDRIPVPEVRAALGLADGSVPTVRRTSPGDAVEVEVRGRATVVPVAEHGCSWTLRPGPRRDLAPGTRTAEFRVFAPPVDAARAPGLVEAAGRAPGCVDLSAEPGTALMGAPGVALACATGELRVEGLVGDAWVVCGLTRRDLTGRRGEAVLSPRLASWCATALEQLDTRS